MLKILKKFKHYKIMKNFSLFALIGVILAFFQIFFLWLFIDFLNYHTLITSALIISLLYTGKFYTYVTVGIMHNKFLHYNITNISLLIVHIIIIWLMVDFLGIYASLSSVIVTILFFFLRFMVLSKAGLIKN